MLKSNPFHLNSIHLWRKAKALAVKLLNFVYPPLCDHCHASITHPHNLCPACFSKIHFVVDPLCQSCGFPLDIPNSSLNTHLLCFPCQKQPASYDLLRSCFIYEDIGRSLILTYKHVAKMELVPLFSKWLEQIITPFINDIDMIVPVPLHPSRQRQRGYNQAGELARYLAKKKKRPYCPDLLIRTVKTPSQGHLSPKQRHDNVKGAFGVCIRSSFPLEGKTILIVDDVMTTGATLEACAKTLKSAGAARVYAVTLARIDRPRPLL